MALPPISVRLAGWTLGISAAMIAVGVVCIFLENDSSGYMSSSDFGSRKQPKPPWLHVQQTTGRNRPQTRLQRPSSIARFWQQLWHAKPAQNATAARASLLPQVLAACGANKNSPISNFIDVKLEIEWKTGDITQHRKVQMLLHSNWHESTEGRGNWGNSKGNTKLRTQIVPPSVRAVWCLCNFAATHTSDFAATHANLRCGKDRLFLEVGSGAAGVAMAARGMVVVVESTSRHISALKELQCTNGRRHCLAKYGTQISHNHLSSIRSSTNSSVPTQRKVISTVGKCANTSNWGAFGGARFKVRSVDKKMAQQKGGEAGRNSNKWAVLTNGENLEVEILHVSEATAFDSPAWRRGAIDRVSS